MILKTNGEMLVATRDAPAFVMVIVVEAAFGFATVADVDVSCHATNESYV